jgi:hypothetical protein
MIIRVTKIDGEDYVITANGDICKRGEFYGKSTDTKPVDNVKNADIFYEMDTKRVFLFDEDGETWIEQ